MMPGPILSAPVYTNLLGWLLDILLHETFAVELLCNEPEIFQFCVEYKIVLHLTKCILFGCCIDWGDCFIFPSGSHFGPRQIECHMPNEEDIKGAHLQQFVCATKWVKHGILGFANLIELLHICWEDVYKPAGKRTKWAAARSSLARLESEEVERSAFAACKWALAKPATVAHCNE